MNSMLLAFIYLSFAAGKFHIARSLGLFEVQEGDNVTIKCQSHPKISLEEYTLDLKRVDGNSSGPTGVVYSRRHGKAHLDPQMEQYRNRVFVINEDLRMGILTVVIRSVRRSDSGLYKCYIPKLNNSTFFTIEVKEKQNRTKENDFSTVATVMEQTTDAGAATKEHHRYHFITFGILIVVVVVVVVFLVLFIKGKPSPSR